MPCGHPRLGVGAACTLSPGRSRRQGLRSALSQPYPCLGHPDAAALQPRGAHTLSRASGTGQERRANASAACPQPLTGVFQVTEAAHLHPSLIITAWWPGAQAPVWSSHNASGVETSRQAPASLCFRRRGDQGHHPGVTCAATGRDVRDPARALTPCTEKRAHRQPHGAPRQAPVSPRPASAWEKRPHTQHHPLGGGSKRQRVPRTSSPSRMAQHRYGKRSHPPRPHAQSHLSQEGRRDSKPGPQTGAQG